jgi:hypothetical protein
LPVVVGVRWGVMLLKSFGRPEAYQPWRDPLAAIDPNDADASRALDHWVSARMIPVMMMMLIMIDDDDDDDDWDCCRTWVGWVGSAWYSFHACVGASTAVGG